MNNKYTQTQFDKMTTRFCFDWDLVNSKECSAKVTVDRWLETQSIVAELPEISLQFRVSIGHNHISLHGIEPGQYVPQLQHLETEIIKEKAKSFFAGVRHEKRDFVWCGGL